MIDDLNPTLQFHPYLPPDAVPVSEQKEDSLIRLSRVTRRLSSRVGRQLSTFGGYLRRNRSIVVAGVVAGLVAARMLQRHR